MSRRKEIITIRVIITKRESKMIQRTNETKSWFVEKIKKIDKALARLIKKIWERTWINKIRNEREVITNNREIQRVVIKYYKQLYANKLNNLKNIEKFLEIHNLPKLIQEETENLNRAYYNQQNWSSNKKKK